MILLKFTILFLTLALSLCKSQLPLCQLCGCSLNKNKAEVRCTTLIHYDILSDTYWVNQKPNSTNTTYTYAYTSVTIENNQYANLSYTFPASTNLTFLSLANNAIVSVTDNIFRNLQNLRVLVLSHNDLQILNPDAFKGLYTEGRLMPLKALRELRLAHNKLHTLNADIFEHTTDLTILDLSHNPLKTLDQHIVSAITSLYYLKELYLQYTGISTLPDSFFHTPKYLEIVDLSGNPFEKIPKTFAEAQSLREIYLNNTNFKNLTEEIGFPDMPTVKVLHLSRNSKLQAVEKHSLSGLENLEDIYLCDNIDLTHIDPFALAKSSNRSGAAIWPPIKKLFIGNNKLSHLDSDIIARWDSLSALDIRANPWTCECENQWLIEDLMPIYAKIDKNMSLEVRCAAPIEMVRYTFYELYEKKSNMRCLDTNGAHPEKDSLILVGVLVGVLMGIPLILLGIFAYQRRWFDFCGICDNNSPASYSRRFYAAGNLDDEYI